MIKMKPGPAFEITSDPPTLPPVGNAPLVNALREAVLRLEAWGPSPADAFWINETAKPLIAKYSNPN